MNLSQISNRKISLLCFAISLISLSGATFKTYGCSCAEPAPCEAFGRASDFSSGAPSKAKNKKRFFQSSAGREQQELSSFIDILSPVNPFTNLPTEPILYESFSLS
jgi:hypothetical protein